MRNIVWSDIGKVAKFAYENGVMKIDDAGTYEPGKLGQRVRDVLGVRLTILDRGISVPMESYLIHLNTRFKVGLRASQPLALGRRDCTISTTKLNSKSNALFHCIGGDMVPFL